MISFAGEILRLTTSGLEASIDPRTENWSVVIRSREMETLWHNWYDAETGTLDRKVFGYG